MQESTRPNVPSLPVPDVERLLTALGRFPGGARATRSAARERHRGAQERRPVRLLRRPRPRPAPPLCGYRDVCAC
jgi:hypothetical protein